MSGFRTDKININYYLENNTPSFYQFKAKDHHFFDKTGRKYIIMEKDGNPFKNKKFQSPKPSRVGKGGGRAGGLTTSIEKPKKCVINNYGEITLYVKLADGSQWFSNSEIGRYITLYERSEKNALRVKLKSTHKINYKVKTGRITVQGLNAGYCNELLNSSNKNERKNKNHPTTAAANVFSFEGLI